MIVFCEDCGARNSINRDVITQTGGVIKCRHCHEPIMIDGSPVVHATDIHQPQLTSYKARMLVRYQGIIIDVDENRTQVTMGRLQKNDIKVVRPHVSRWHAKIEYRNGKYILIDQSKNGTYVLLQGRRGFFLKQDWVLLINKGYIGLGGRVTPESTDAIGFDIRV